MDCPSCKSSRTEILESRRCSNGTRRRRHSCLDCQARWTTWDGVRPEKGPVHTRRSGKKRTTRLPHEAIRKVLLAPRSVSHSALAREIGVSPEFIRQVRVGDCCKSIHPEIARWGKPAPEVAGQSCYRCVHWRAECSFGFPDPQIEGPAFAADCHLYQEQPLTQSMSFSCPSWVQ